MDVYIIPILDDNYAYVIKTNDMIGVIDPGESQPIITFLQDRGMALDWVINTHKHWDHVNGNRKLLEKYNAKWAAPSECGESMDVVLEDGKKFEFGDIQFDVTLTKGHTKNHVVLFDPTYRVLFSGDTLFSMGCGRLFEGTPQDMFKSMEYIKSLPPETVIYCGHEYTKTNAEFSMTIFGDNKDVANRYEDVQGKVCTVPTLLATELKTNPFLLANTVDEFAQYRAKRDTF